MKRIIALSLIFVTIACCFAQKDSVARVTISGIVLDQKGQNIEYATVVLLQDSVQKAGTITNDKGYFTLEAVTGKYSLAVQCLGHVSAQKDIRLFTSLEDTIRLTTSKYALKEIVIQAKSIERKADRFIVQVPPTSGKDGTELLSQAPGVWLTDEDISINGANGTKVFVDNREIKLDGEKLIAYLHSLKSEEIKRIEIIPIAGSEYDADMNGGVIQIYLRRRQENGFQGNISMGTTIAPSLNKYIPSLNINSQAGKWNFNGALSGIFTPTNKAEMTSTRNYRDEERSFESFSEFNPRTNYGTGRIGIIFEMDSLNSIGAEIEYTQQGSNDNSNSLTHLSQTGTQLKSIGDYHQENDFHTVSATMNYLHKLDKNGSLLKVIADYTNKKSTGHNNYQTTQESHGWSNDTIYRNRTKAVYDIATADLSIKKNLRKNMWLNAGLKYTYTCMDDNSAYEGLSKEQNWEINSAYSYSLLYKENIMGAYVSYSTELGKWSLAGGLRGEYTRTSDESHHIKRDYLDLFPNLNVTYAFDRMKQWMLVGQYARNVERPPFHALNPNHLQTSDYSYQIGNPYLRPTYINRFSATLVYNYRFTLTVGGNLHHDLIREFCKQDATNPDVSYITFENHDIENHWFVAVNLPFQPVRWLNLTANFVGVKQDIRMTETASFANHYLMFANANATFFLPASYSFELQYSGASRLYSGNSEVAPRHTLSLIARKKFMNDRLVVSAGINNLFNRYNDYANNLDAYSTQTHYREAASGRNFKITLSWNFNSGKKVSKGKIERSSEEEQNRLKEK